jgi:hypothetical protein
MRRPGRWLGRGCDFIDGRSRSRTPGREARAQQLWRLSGGLQGPRPRPARAVPLRPPRRRGHDAGSGDSMSRWPEIAPMGTNREVA